LTTLPPVRRLTLALAIALSMGALVAALIGPAETLAQTHKSACSSSAAPAKRSKGTSHPCPSHKSKGKGHGSSTKAKHTKKRHKKGPLLRIPASCEDGNAPVPSEGSFHCSDGSEPQCVDGATPAVSRNGKMLLCPAVATAEGEAGSSEAECEEEELECVASSGSDEEACEAAASGSIACEGEAES
jgi:hypothetical protein